MKKIFLIVTIFGMATPLQAAISKELDQRLNTILTRLNEAKKPNDYPAEIFSTDIKNIAVEFYKGRLNTIDSSVTPLKRELIALSRELNKADNEERVKELKAWYGGYAHEIPDQYLNVYREQGAKISRMLGGKEQTLEELRESLKNGNQQDQSKAIPYSPPTAKLRDEHTEAKYISSWKFWLMSPPSKERDFMRSHINQALNKIGKESVIPLMVKTFKIESQREKGKKIRRGGAIATINLICGMVGAHSLDALLEINRFAIKNGLNGDDYYKSITRHIVRRLASRRAYADQLIDPQMKTTIERQGYNEKPEDIPLIDDLWKKYKPILEARIKTKTSETPQADIDLIQSALQIMPEK